MNNNRETILENEPSIDTEIRHITKAGTNIFLDLGFPEDEAIELKLESDRRIKKDRLKIQLMTYLIDYVKDYDLTHKQMADVLKISRPRVTDLVNKKTKIFSIDELITLIYRLPNSPDIQLFIANIDETTISDDKTIIID